MDTQEAKTFTLVLIICITLGTIIAYFIFSIIRQNSRTRKLQKSVVLAELTAMEKERARIATDLHDDVSPLLSVVKFQVDSVETASPDEAEQLQQASRYIDDILHRVREISNNLMPSSLLQKGLTIAIREYISRVEEGSGMRISLTYDENLQLREELYANIYRIVQEVIHNCRKHAKAQEMIVKLEKHGALLHIFIRDNGIGFNAKEILRHSHGIGLQSLNNRAKVLGGTMVVESEAGNGTAFLFKIPLN